MATTHTLECWKQHKCVGCGGIFRYRLQRSTTRKGSTPEAAAQDAQTELRRVIKNAVDPRPCPSCGALQPEMIGQRSARAHGRLILASIAITIIALILGGGAFARNDTVWIVVVAVTLVGIGHLVTAMTNPNNNLARNLEKARADVDWKITILETPGTKSPPNRVSGAEKSSSATLVAFMLLAMSVVGAASSEARRLAGAWPLNRGFDPPVVGPGDTSRLEFPYTISSVKGYWSGAALVNVTNASDLGASGAHFFARSANDSWGDSIKAKSSATNRSSTVYADITVPDDASMAGKTPKLMVDLSVRYPSSTGASSFTEETRSFSHTASLVLAPPGAGSTYQWLWGRGIQLGGLAAVVAGIILYRHANRMSSGFPTKIFPIESGNIIASGTSPQENPDRKSARGKKKKRKQDPT